MKWEDKKKQKMWIDVVKGHQVIIDDWCRVTFSTTKTLFFSSSAVFAFDFGVRVVFHSLSLCHLYRYNTRALQCAQDVCHKSWTKCVWRMTKESWKQTQHRNLQFILIKIFSRIVCPTDSLYIAYKTYRVEEISFRCCSCLRQQFKMYNAMILSISLVCTHSTLCFSCENVVRNIDMHADGYDVLYLMCHATKKAII